MIRTFSRACEKVESRKCIRNSIILEVISFINHVIIFLGFKFSPKDYANNNATATAFHKIIETFKYAYARRALLGDKNYANVSKVRNSSRNWLSNKLIYHTAHLIIRSVLKLTRKLIPCLAVQQDFFYRPASSHMENVRSSWFEVKPDFRYIFQQIYKNKLHVFRSFQGQFQQ